MRELSQAAQPSASILAGQRYRRRAGSVERLPARGQASAQITISSSSAGGGGNAGAGLLAAQGWMLMVMFGAPPAASAASSRARSASVNDSCGHNSLAHRNFSS